MKKQTIRRIKRKCLVCGTKINIVLRGRIYNSGHYFGKIKLPLKPGEYKKIGSTKVGRTMVDVVKWTGKHEKIGYWESINASELISYIFLL